MIRFLILLGMLAAFPCIAVIGEEPGVLRRSFADLADPAPPFPEGRFEPRPGETLAWIGGTEIRELDRHGFLEVALHRAWPGHVLRWRNLAWEGDTVFRQARPMYFYTEKGDPQPGSLPDHRERTAPGIVLLCFGKMESLEGADRLPDFLAAYAGVLDDLVPLTPRLVLVEPPPFFPSGPAAGLASSRNATLAAYAEGIAGLARERGLLLLRSGSVEWNPNMSDDGVHLNASGHRAWAAGLLEKMGLVRDPGPPPLALRESIARKNLLWQQYYRPTNWAFLFGDRQHVPASRDVEQREERWFVREIDALPALIAEAEADIARYAKEAAESGGIPGDPARREDRDGTGGGHGGKD